MNPPVCRVVMMLVRMFHDWSAAILLLRPWVVSIGNANGIHSVQLGLMMVINLSIRLYTSRVGTMFFISAAIAHCSTSQTTLALQPMYLVALAVLATD
ncbi:MULTISPECIES: TRAP transporter large permease subunit [unclassified Yoonia]|uniref:TRAP transporter large permease subunit n=1 Tax=unclassified Yoonia TaxID=2629118 RepID=UPI002AFFF046|nr:MULTISPECIES: TRAP transporter large permease subunit [unclassified Yoonia]